MFEYEIELEYGLMRLTVLIEFSYDQPECHPYAGGVHYTPGHLYIEDVLVRVMEGWGQNGQSVYKNRRDDIGPGWLEMLEEFAHSYIEDEVEEVGHLAETLIGIAS